MPSNQNDKIEPLEKLSHFQPVFNLVINLLFFSLPAFQGYFGYKVTKKIIIKAVSHISLKPHVMSRNPHVIVSLLLNNDNN